jgi:hypothetical protein
MDHELQKLVWSKLPLNAMQRQDLLNDIICDMHVPMKSKQDLEMTSQVIKKRKRTTAEQSENQNHMC